MIDHSAPFLQATNLHYSRDHRGQTLQILRGAELTVNAGESVAIMGRSGSGKSTLLSVLSGRLIPHVGTVMIDGVELSQQSESARAQFRLERCGWVFQDFGLIPTLTALDNVALPLQLRGVSRAEAHRAAHTSLEQVGLSQRTAHRPGELSGGEQQRVGVARALVGKPELILADEPTAALDEELREDLATLLFEVSTNATLIVVTHDRHLADRMDRHYTLDAGVLAEQRQ